MKALEARQFPYGHMQNFHPPDQGHGGPKFGFQLGKNVFADAQPQINFNDHSPFPKSSLEAFLPFFYVR